MDGEKPLGLFLKPNLHQNKVLVTVWSFAPDLTRYSFLNPGETITSEKYAQQIDAMHQKLQGLQPVLVNRKGPVLLYNNTQLPVLQSMFPKLNKLDFEILHHPPYSPDLSPAVTSSSILITFCREKTSITSRRQKMLSMSSSNPEA